MKKLITLLALATVGGLALGCSSARDVQVKGEIQGGLSQQDVLVEFWDLTDSEQTKVHSVTVQAPGSFDETVPLEGDQLLVRAIADNDDNGVCTPGEQWGETDTALSDGDETLAITVTLSGAACEDSKIGN